MTTSTHDVRKILSRMKRIPTDNATFDDACDAYLDRGEIGKTDGIYLDRLRRDLGVIMLDNITRRLIDVMITAERKGRGLADGSIRRELNTCQAILNYAVEMELTTNIVNIRKPSDSPARDVWLDSADVRLFLEYCPTAFRPFAAFLFYTGARLGEAIEAKWEDVVNGAVIFSSRKGKGSRLKRRSVPLHDDLMEYIDTGRREGYILKFNGHRWHRRDIYDFWNTAKDKLGVEGLTPHCARHTFASLLIIADVDSRTVAELLGHSSMDMMKRYTHLNTSHLKSAVSRMSF